MNRNREFVAVLVIGGTLLAFYWLASAYLTETSAPTPTIETRATRLITVAGTGKLEEEGGKLFVRGTGQPEVELGTIEFHRNRRTIIHPMGADLGGPTVEVVADAFREHYLNQRVSVIATVEVVADNEKVFRAVRTARMTIFRHSDGLPER